MTEIVKRVRIANDLARRTKRNDEAISKFSFVNGEFVAVRQSKANRGLDAEDSQESEALQEPEEFDESGLETASSQISSDLHDSSDFGEIAGRAETMTSSEISSERSLKKGKARSIARSMAKR